MRIKFFINVRLLILLSISLPCCFLMDRIYASPSEDLSTHPQLANKYLPFKSFYPPDNKNNKFSSHHNSIRIYTLHQDAVITINADQLGYYLFLDGKFIGESPIANKTIEPGSHSLLAYRHFYPAWGVIPWHYEFVVEPSEKISLHIPKIRFYAIKSKPFAAEVYLNNTLLGTTPLYINLEADATNNLLVKKSGYKDYSLQLDFQKLPTIDVVLVPEAESEKKTQQIYSKKINNLKTKRVISWICLGTTLISGAAALHFKHEANENYDRYLRSGNPNQMNEYFDNSIRYDNYATFAFGSFQVNFVLWAYFFFRSR